MIELPIKVSKKIDLKDKNIHQKTEKTYNDLKKQFLTEDEEVVLGEFSDKLKKLRQRKKWSQQKLCDVIAEKYGGDVKKSSIYKYEQGVQIPTIYALKYIAKALGVSSDYLIGNSDVSITNTDEYIQKETGLNQKVIDRLKEDMK